MKLIINADDCGKSLEVNAAIKTYIEAGKITSTTVMANMLDIEGAAKLYNEFKKEISFGIHLNLTEGEPLLQSDILLNEGLYVKTENGIQFNINSYRNRLLNGSIENEIKKELIAQFEKVYDYGINISHIDSHHHIHTGLILLRLIPQLARRYKITKIRRMRNYVPLASVPNKLLRDAWYYLVKIQNFDLYSTNLFGIFEDWYNAGCPLFNANTVIELMSHPGGIYHEENEKLLNTDFSEMKGLKLISYTNL